MISAPLPPPAASAHLRVARPSQNLYKAEEFWVRGLEMQVLWRSRPEAEADFEHGLLMLGWPGSAWHLELVDDPTLRPSPTAEDLLVLYLGEPVSDDIIQRMVSAGGQRVSARNSYWDEWGVTIQDPDGYRIVLSHRDWTNANTQVAL